MILSQSSCRHREGIQAFLEHSVRVKTTIIMYYTFATIFQFKMLTNCAYSAQGGRGHGIVNYTGRYPKFYKQILLFVGLKTLETLITTSTN